MCKNLIIIIVFFLQKFRKRIRGRKEGPASLSDTETAVSCHTVDTSLSQELACCDCDADLFLHLFLYCIISISFLQCSAACGLT